MKIIDNTIYAEKSDFKKGGKTDNDIDVATAKGTKTLPFVKFKEYGATKFFPIDKIGGQWKNIIWNLYNNDPYDYVCKEPIKALVTKDYKAEEYYRSKLIEMKVDASKLQEYINRYTTAASWLNMVNKATEKNFIRKTLHLTVDKFWKHVCQLIAIDKIDLPSSYNRLRMKAIEYKGKGYECLVDWRFGNKLAAKIGKEEETFNPELAATQEAIIRKAASMHNNFDNAQITRGINEIFKKQGWESVSLSTVRNIVVKNEHIITPGRRGVKQYNNTMAMQLKRAMPTHPLLYCTLDGWTVELLYQDETGFHHRMVMVVVLDAFKKYPLGYAIGDRENAALIRQALKNALLHTTDLFGNTYRPWQLQSDNFGIKENTPFYNAVAHLHTPAAVGNAKAKIIEPYFNYLNRTYCQRQFNWSGFNVDSKKDNQPNRELLDKIKHSIPDKQGVINQIMSMMETERSHKAAEYLEAWHTTPQEDKALMNIEDKLFVLGTSTGYLNSITGQGLQMTIGGNKRLYDSFNPAFRANQHLAWKVLFDDDNLNQVLAVSEDGKQRFLLNEKKVLPMDIRSMTPEDHNYLSQVNQFNKTRREEIIQTYVEDADRTDKALQNVSHLLTDDQELDLKMMFTFKGEQKGRIQDAKGLKRIQQQTQKQEVKSQAVEVKNWQVQQQEFLQNRTDLSKYID